MCISCRIGWTTFTPANIIMACSSEYMSDILPADEKINLSIENKIVKEIPDDPQNSSDVLESSMLTTKISTAQASNPKASSVDKMPYREVFKLLDRLGITEMSEDPNCNKNLLKEILYGGRGREASDEKAKHMVDTMKKYKAVKGQLVDSYSNFISITNMDTFKKELQKPLEKRFPAFIKKMKDRLEILKKDSSEFQIVVTGETSAGKSTFLNILLGRKILPSTLLHTTSCICRLHNSSDKKVSYGDKDDNKILQLTSDDPEAIEKELMLIIGPKSAEDKNTLRVVDIYWPIPLLQENVILVDTPGIGETTLLSKQIVEYVPTADGYIFIIDSSHGGGVQEDRLLYLLKEIKRKQGSKMRDFSNFLFVCNKWDLVGPQDVDIVWQNTWEKLKLVCPTLEKWQVIKFSSQLELDLLNLKANHSDSFLAILTGLENILMGEMHKRIGNKLEWIHTFMMEMNNLQDTQIAGAGSDLSILQHKAVAAKKILDNASAILETEANEALKHVQTKSRYLAENLREYIDSLATFETLANRLQSTLTPMLLRISGREHLSLQMETMLLIWINNGPLLKESETIDEKIDTLEKQMKTTLQTIEWFGFKTTFVRNEGGFLSRIKSLRGPGPLQASIGLLVCFVLGVLLSPFTFGLTMLIPLVLSSTYLFIQMRSLLINRMARTAIEHAKSQSSRKTLVQNCFEMPYAEQITKLKKEFEFKISFIRKTIEKMEKDARNRRNLSSVLHEFRNKIKEAIRQLQKVHILYGDKNVVPIEQLGIGQILSKTDMFHLHIVTGNFKEKHVTLRVLDPNFSTFYLKEIDNIRAMDHENFSSHLAVAFATSTLNELPESMESCDCNDDWLRVLIEPSTGDLETYVFTNKNKIGCVVGESARATFLQISSGISNGLSYIHSKDLVHGHLQLSAVLLCGPAMVPKLCDVNVLPFYKERNHEKCIYHTAPEVIRDGTYKQKADVYSFGILLWELWYGQHTKQNETLSELRVCRGERPKFEDIRPLRVIENLITMCWDGDMNKRPTAKDVCERLLKLKELVDIRCD